MRILGTDLGGKVLGGEWPAVHALLAPWLRASWTIEQVPQFLKDEYRATLEANGAEGTHYPEFPEPGLDGNGFTKATQLRESISC